MADVMNTMMDGVQVSPLPSKAISFTMDQGFYRFLLTTFVLIHAFSSTSSQPYIGVNYGVVADNLPPPAQTARLLVNTTISKVRLYGVDPAFIQALAGTNISLVLGVANGEIPALAADPSTAAAWVSSKIFPFIPASSISAISVGNEILTESDQSLSSQLLPAMQNLRLALSSSAAAAGIKVSTVNSMAVLAQSDPPSAGAFHPELATALQPILQFLHDGGHPFMINPYPYFAYQSDPRPETLAFCLFQPGPGRPDPGSGIAYANMFDAQVDAVRAALRTAGFPDMEVVVAETGWPDRGDPAEVGAGLENAETYNRNLVAHLRGAAQPVETYIFALFDEDLKPGPTSERSFGLFKTDLTPAYEAGLLKTGKTEAESPSPLAAGPPAPSEPGKGLITAAPQATEAVAPAVECAAGRGGAACGRPAVQYRASAPEGSGAGIELPTTFVIDRVAAVFFLYWVAFL
ncbi:hypothetical protein HPP92_021287 [Vanilla planifolia]|uniref:glucan endo-1,3-beta-D-glucosidase n=1 Tax=Vanilla planifolia TaxID=51239 RepID=A0A835UHE9_VANPL|nr:hypothetical protein HPP92_021287 [Vanilla planifolia]